MKKYILNIGLAFTLAFAGIDSLMHPLDWIGFVPDWVNIFGVTRDIALLAHSFTEIILAILLLTGWKTGIVAWIIFLDMWAIILVNGFGRSSFLITFRDIGLLAVALYLALPEPGGQEKKKYQ